MSTNSAYAYRHECAPVLAFTWPGAREDSPAARIDPLRWIPKAKVQNAQLDLGCGTTTCSPYLHCPQCSFDESIPVPWPPWSQHIGLQPITEQEGHVKCTPPAWHAVQESNAMQQVDPFSMLLYIPTGLWCSWTIRGCWCLRASTTAHATTTSGCWMCPARSGHNWRSEGRPQRPAPTTPPSNSRVASTSLAGAQPPFPPPQTDHHD